MAKMIEALHDVIDSREALRERAESIVDDVVSNHLEEVMGTVGAEDPRKVLAVIASMIEERLTDLTTEAVHTGAEHARRLSKLAR